MRVQGGLKREDWEHWGQFTTFKENAAELVARQSRPEQLIYCSPLTDPYQPAEGEAVRLPTILRALIQYPPKLFAIQTRGPLIVRDLDLLRELNRVTRLRVSFSLTTNRDDVRRWYEPHCEPLEDRLAAIRRLRDAGIRVFATLAPILPCEPEELAAQALAATCENIIGDPFHVRAVKRHGATTRPQAWRVSQVRGFTGWHDPQFQQEIIERIRRVVNSAGRAFATGPEGFQWLAQA